MSRNRVTPIPLPEDEQENQLPNFATQAWECSLTSSAPLLGDTGTLLEIAVFDRDSPLRSEAHSVDNWLPPNLLLDRVGKPSWGRSGRITLPSAIKTPGAVLIRKLRGPGGPSVDYISAIQFVSEGEVFTIPVKSWVSSEQGWRVFFAGTAYLPQNTPPSLLDERRRDLADIQGTPDTRIQTREAADRIYWYQVYDDLGTAKLPRPNLGDSKALPYPRRLATNRGTNPDGSEVPPAHGVPWLPFDETFSYNKQKDFLGGALQSTLGAAFALLGNISGEDKMTFGKLLPAILKGFLRSLFCHCVPGQPDPIKSFGNFTDVLAMFGEDASKSLGFRSIQPMGLYPGDKLQAAEPPAQSTGPSQESFEAWNFRLTRPLAKKLTAQAAEERVGPIYQSATGGAPTIVAGSGGAPPQPDADDISRRLGELEWNRVLDSARDINDLLYFPVPRMLEGRPDAWYTDEEYGRQMLAGFNPVTITALKQLPEEFGSAIRNSDVAAELQGSTLEQLVASAAAGDKPRLYFIDYWDMGAFWDIVPKAEGKVVHKGRALFYLRTNEATGADEALIPVAIELAHADTHRQFPNVPSTAGIVYSRAALAHSANTLAVWRLAKVIFRSLDFHIHEVYSHFTRAHAVTEPFLIALRRQLSTMHPVFKLMLPHFRYTLNINRNARTSLINAGGIIESAYSAGDVAIRLGAVLYGKYWTFAGQALPEDLKSRGMINPADGKPWLDYPFAEDGLDLWAAYEKYFSEYLDIYYSSDQDVLDDVELQAWWDEVKNEGHPDLVKFGLRTEAEVWGFTGPIPNKATMVQVLATIAWIASGHHAAINFGQYDMGTLILNVSSLVRRVMPAPEEPAYQELVSAALGTPQEKIFMTYLADPLSTVKVLATLQLLSGHAEDEQTLDQPNHFLMDPPAKVANQKFRTAMQQLELAIQTRNANPTKWARYSLSGSRDGAMPYTLLMPSSGAGITMRGVPYSVSI